MKWKNKLLCLSIILLCLISFLVYDNTNTEWNQSTADDTSLSHTRIMRQPKTMCGGATRVTAVNHPLPNYNQSTIRKSQVVVLPTFPLLTNANQNTSTFVQVDPAYNKPTLDDAMNDKLGERMLDYLESLLHTLNHPLVSEVIIRYDQDLMPDYLLCRIGRHPKLKLIRTMDTYSPFKTLEFVHKHLQDRLVMITNADVYPGEGLEHLDYDRMKRNRLFYGLSRHGRTETRCEMPPEHCDVGMRHGGACDAYTFIPLGPLREDGEKWLKSYKWDSYGTENMIMKLYQSHLKYTVLNPCKVIFIYHNHCSKIRRAFSERYVEKRRGITARPSDRLG